MTEKQICKQLNVTSAGLRTLAKASAKPDGEAFGDGMGRASVGARARLERTGLINAGHIITQQGREVVAQARSLGW